MGSPWEGAGRYTLPCKKGDRLPNSVSLSEYFDNKVLYCEIRSVITCICLATLPVLQVVEAPPGVHLPDIQAHHQTLLQHLVRACTIQNLKTSIERDQYPATSTSYLAYPANLAILATPANQVSQPFSHSS